MKVEWEATDIHAGLIVGKIGRVERLMIGYTYDANGKKECCSISLVDGLICIVGDTSAMATWLNVNSELPEGLLPTSERGHQSKGKA
jgi:hypothetical protein